MAMFWPRAGLKPESQLPKYPPGTQSCQDQTSLVASQGSCVALQFLSGICMAMSEQWTATPLLQPVRMQATLLSSLNPAGYTRYSSGYLCDIACIRNCHAMPQRFEDPVGSFNIIWLLLLQNCFERKASGYRILQCLTLSKMESKQDLGLCV